MHDFQSRVTSGLRKHRGSGMIELAANELVIDYFAGAGGASSGIEEAIGRPIDIAINHDPEAVAMHAANHPLTKHYCKDIWEADPLEVTQGRPVGLGWFSPDCKHFGWQTCFEASTRPRVGRYPLGKNCQAARNFSRKCE